MGTVLPARQEASDVVVPSCHELRACLLLAARQDASDVHNGHNFCAGILCLAWFVCGSDEPMVAQADVLVVVIPSY